MFEVAFNISNGMPSTFKIINEDSNKHKHNKTYLNNGLWEIKVFIVGYIAQSHLVWFHVIVEVSTEVE